MSLKWKKTCMVGRIYGGNVYFMIDMIFHVHGQQMNELHLALRVQALVHLLSSVF